MPYPTPTYPGRWLSPSELERIDAVASREPTPRGSRPIPGALESAPGGVSAGPFSLPRKANSPVRLEDGPATPPTDRPSPNPSLGTGAALAGPRTRTGEGPCSPSPLNRARATTRATYA